MRGLSYYTGFVFEAFDRKGDLRALAGGGRYNDLVARYGGPQLPAVGFAIGDMTFQLLLEARGLAPAIVQSPDVYIVAGEAERSIALGFVNDMRAAGIRTEYALKAPAFGKQFKLAGQSGARLALVFGAEEVARGAAKIRDMRSGSETEETLENLPEAIREALRS